jgi:sialic acid synthase SpsE
MTVEQKLKDVVEVRGRRISVDDPVYIIGEVACAHQGDLEKARALTEAVVVAGADAVQLEIFDPDANMAPSNELYPLLQKLCFTADEWRQLVDHARGHDIALSIFAYDEPSLELALELQPDMLKLNSSELSHPEMVAGAARSGLPFTVGTGASTLGEIRAAVSLALSNGGDQMILMHGVQNFPTPSAEANVRRIRRLRDEFGCLVIFADHTDANTEFSRWIDLIALGEGAALLEKHVVLDRAAQGVDWQASLEPAEFKAYVETMRAGSQALGPYEPPPLSEGDRRYRRFQKKKIVAAHDLEVGMSLLRDDVKFLRTGTDHGLSPADFAAVEGAVLRRPVLQYDPIVAEDLESPTG